MGELKGYLEDLGKNKIEIDITKLPYAGLQLENYIRIVLTDAYSKYREAFDYVIKSGDDTEKIEFIKWMAENRWLMCFRWVLFQDGGRNQEQSIIDTISSDENKKRGKEIAGIKDSENQVNTVRTNGEDSGTR